MFFSDFSDIPRLIKSTHTTIFAIAPDTALDLPHPLEIAPLPGKSTITIDQIRELTKLSQAKQTTERFIIIRHAEQLGPESANALLKLLEEPGNNYHFVLLTLEPYALLPTILSRTSLFIPHTQNSLSKKPLVSEQTITLAKRLLSATPANLPSLADEIAKIKDGSRQAALAATATAIELAYKSYFATKNPRFLKRIPKLILLHRNLKANGNLKLHIVADLC